MYRCEMSESERYRLKGTETGGHGRLPNSDLTASIDTVRIIVHPMSRLIHPPRRITMCIINLSPHKKIR